MFFLLTYLGRKSITLVPTRPTVIDAMLRALATQLVPLSTTNGDAADPNARADHQLISWLMLFLSVCLDDAAATTTATEKKEPHATRWEFMSGETDMTKSRGGTGAGHGNRSFSRSFKKRYLQGKAPTMIGNGVAGMTSAAGGSGGNGGTVFTNDKSAQVAQLTNQIEMALKQQEHLIKKHNVKLHQLQCCLDKTKSKLAVKISAWPKVGGEASGSAGGAAGGPSGTTASAGTSSSGGGGSDPEPAFDRGLRSLKISNTIVVIRGLIGLLLTMNYTCNMDLFLLTCKVRDNWANFSIVTSFS